MYVEYLKFCFFIKINRKLLDLVLNEYSRYVKKCKFVKSICFLSLLCIESDSFF